MALSYNQPEISEAKNRPATSSNKGYPYSALDHRRFEELLYSIGKLRLEKDWKDKYDEINLLQGVRERGRDCSLHLNGNSLGLIQCKHSIDSGNRISRPECAREIIKFVLHYLLDKRLIYNPKNFTYWFAVSYGFNEKAKDLLDDFNREILKQTELKDWTETVINANEELKHLKYNDIEQELKTVLASIAIKKVIPQDLDTLLNSNGFQSIIKTFFEVKMVVESEPVEKLMEELKKQSKYQNTSNIPVQVILQKFDHASHYLTDYNSSFEGVANSHIKRKETNDLLHWIKSPLGEKEKAVVLLVGSAGSGKTVIIKDVFLRLKETGIPTIALKADRLYAESINELQNKIDLGDSFEKVVRTLSEASERVVVLIDQIDALSQSLSAKREFLDAYNLLVRKLIDIDRVRVVISVRAYDLYYDNELKFYKNQKSFKVDLLNVGDVKQVLAKLGIRENELPGQLLNLLQTPHHLNVFCKVYDSQTNLQSITTLHDLYESLWVQQITTVTITSPTCSDKCTSLVFAIADQMHKEQRISTPAKQFSLSFKDEFDYLRSNGIITETDKEVQFFHQTFFDFVFAKQFVQNGNSVTRYILENHQGLFIRSSLKMILGFLREEDHAQFIKALNAILFSSKYRFHIKLMLLNLLGFEEAPTLEEKQLVKSRILPSKELKLPFLESVAGNSWFSFLIREGELNKLITQKIGWHNKLAERDWGKANKVVDKIKTLVHYKNTSEKWDAQINLLWQILVKQLPKSRQSVCDFLLNCPEFKGKARFVSRLLYHVKEWDIPAAFQLFEKNDVKAGFDSFGYYNILKDALKFDFDWVKQKYKDICLKKIQAIKDRKDKPNFEHQDEKLLKRMFEVDTNKTLDLTLDIINQIIAKTSGEDKSKLYIDFSFWLFNYELNGRSHGYDAIYHLLVDKVQEQAQQTTPWFDQFFADHLNSNSITILRLLFYGLSANPAHYVNDIFQLMELFHQKDGLDGDDKIQFQFRQVLTTVYPHFDNSQKDQIDRILLSIKSKYELDIYQDENGKKHHRLKWYGYHQFLYLTSLPLSEVMAKPILKKSFQELQRKFKTVMDEEPNKIKTYGVGPPMDSSAYDKMTFDQWEQTFKKYNAEYKAELASSRGSLSEHSRAFQAEVQNKGSHFFPFIEELIDENEVPYQYIIAGLTGLKDSKYNPTEVQRIYKKAMSIPFDREYTLYFVWVSSYFIEAKILDQQVLKYLIEIAKNHPDPEGNTIRNDVLMDGANSVRGSAAGRISEVYFNPTFENLVFEALNQIAEDPNLSVRVAIMPRLAMLMHLNEQKTLEIFLKLVNTNEPEIMKHSIWSVQYLINNNFDKLSDYFQRAIKIESIHGSIAVVLGGAWLKEKKGSYQLLNSLLKISDEAKAKLVDMAVKNLADKKESVRAKCRQIFLRFRHSTDQRVIQEYSSTFFDLTPEMFLEVYPLLKKYARSNVARKEPHYYFEYLLKCAKKHPVECLEILGHVNTYDKPDISQAGYYDDEPVKVLIGIYNSLSSLEVKNPKYLNKTIALFDKMLKTQKFRGAANKVIDQVEK
ncbi:NACHT domain-containing protein [Leeuwenhoekiella sp. MAR_2009_132]|uniref:NACHT domain-containing protein n=1 Tax=Leeuwenhoekiella sp. MAR_2009_132 TaxID=1392489 RepID=UPI00048AA084|nr:ATP-binding protein [Leeuwenhoekiella sp. MAR_2009_132]